MPSHPKRQKRNSGKAGVANLQAEARGSEILATAWAGFAAPPRSCRPGSSVSVPRRHGSDHPHLVGARLAAAIIIDDLERNALIFLQQVGVHQVICMNEYVRTAIIRNDESEAPSVVVERHFSVRHFLKALSVFVLRAISSFCPAWNFGMRTTSSWKSC